MDPARGEMQYRLCQVEGAFGISLHESAFFWTQADHAPFPAGVRTGRAKPYKVEQTMMTTTETELKLRHGQSVRHFTMEAISNSPFTDVRRPALRVLLD